MTKKSGDDEDSTIIPEVIPPPGNKPSDRNRAYRIGKAIRAGESVPPEDLSWLDAYERGKRTRASSRSKRVTFTSEEQEQSAEGDPTLAAALAAPQLAREEGRRIDSLIKEATNAMQAANRTTINACELVMKFGALVLERNGKLEANNIGMLDTFRKSHIEMTHAHSALIQQQAEHEADDIVRQADDETKEKDDGGGDMVDGIIQQFLPVIIAEMQKRAMGKKVEE